jgi:F0F1-type ATP synthase assembly protein I
VGEESLQQEQETGQKTENEESKTTKEIVHQKRKKNERKRGSSITQGSSFVHGLATGLGIGCITAFVMMWMAVFFTPRLPIGITYEAMLATFIYPLIYLFALGLIALTVGIVAEYYTVKNRI